jgi:hypothetical protein
MYGGASVEMPCTLKVLKVVALKSFLSSGNQGTNCWWSSKEEGRPVTNRVAGINQNLLNRGRLTIRRVTYMSVRQFRHHQAEADSKEVCNRARLE